MERKRIVMFVLVMLVLLTSLFVFVSTTEACPNCYVMSVAVVEIWLDFWQLSEPAYNVKVTGGTPALPRSAAVTLPTNAIIGGSPSRYLILDETREFKTTVGKQIIESGEKINCASLPHEPIPCTGS